MARTYEVEQSSSEEEVVHFAAAEVPDVVQVGVVWSIAQVMCSNRFEPLQTWPGDASRVGRGAQCRESGMLSSALAQSPKRRRPDSSDLSRACQEGVRGGGRGAEGSRGHRPPEPRPMDSWVLSLACPEGRGGGTAGFSGDRKQAGRSRAAGGLGGSTQRRIGSGGVPAACREARENLDPPLIAGVGVPDTSQRAGCDGTRSAVRGPGKMALPGRSADVIGVLKSVRLCEIDVDSRAVESVGPKGWLPAARP